MNWNEMWHLKKILLFIVTLNVAFGEHPYTNALIKEDSPYLQQHAHNPVDWYPWGKEAFEKAKKENKLIFISIGYSTCHWCHVMEEESFTEERVAKVLNENYVAIKVDREAFPQLDKKYQKLYMSIYGERGGWPLSIFMSPDAEVFHLATYIPIEEAYGSIGLMNMLPSFIKKQHEDAEAFKKDIAEYKEAEHKANASNGIKKLSLKVLNRAVKDIALDFDVDNAGFSFQPKFPEASKLELLLCIYQLTQNKNAFTMAKETLTAMAEGGIYDQIGGGFFRYTTDNEWQIPHFEKMLYTNAELIPLYVKLYKMTGDTLYKRVVKETISQMENNFMEKGVYLSASDADSDGEEGGYFIYAYEAVKKDLLDMGMNLPEIDAVLAYLGIEEDGNIDGDFSHAHLTSQTKPDHLQKVKSYLRGVSAKREFPFVDKKIITAWNSMMIKALFSASSLDKKYLALAEERLETLLMMMRKKKVLYHQTLLGKEAKQKALLEDYAFLMDALIEGYLKTYDKKYLMLLKTLANESLDKFYREKQWFLSNDGFNAKADFDDRYYTSALSKMLENLVRLSSLTENLTYNEMVKETIRNLGAVLEKSPAKAPKLLHTFLRLKRGDIIIKSTKEKLQEHRDQIESMQYPFVLSKPEESDKYLACRVNSCFAYDTNLTDLIDKINKVVK